MTESPGPYSVYLRPQHQVRVGFHLADNNVIDLNAVIISINDDILHLETFGSSTVQLSQVSAGAPAIILSSENWAFCRCQGVFDTTVGRDFTIRLHGEPEIQQRREHFRMDVFIPICYSLPDDQQISSVEGIWKARRMMCEFTDLPKAVPYQESVKILNWDGGPDIEPTRVNLSGGGLRIKAPEQYSPGAYLNMNLFLPMASIKVIDAVVSIIRSTEIRLNLDNRPAFTTAMKFVFLAERDRESIINYIFNEQRNALRAQL
ncbi:pilZ domain protein [Geobacter sp. OR-1]|uniref:PilZ-like domain-containing protein n=1 Tax=Geobacter sp. OR-1 TaxID=1266765 RepID=UPI0005421FF8|nr:PilZ-like domain-containing protein [Geobacter sp. OR-1]GAM09663.1 pilZ domain protein [Geobacter sp. OR-1]